MMSRALARKERMQFAARELTQPISLPAPSNGWNTRDSFDTMDPLDAIQLDNFYPDVSGVNVRNGYQLYAQLSGAGPWSSGFSSGFWGNAAFTSPIKTLAEYSSGATRKFLAAGSGYIFDISASGLALLPLAGPFGEDGWQVASFLSKLFWVNGTDTMQVFDGTSFAAGTFTGVTLSTLVGALVYQQRLFFWANNSTGFWFAPLNSISGALSFFDLQAFSPNGGNLVAATRFSHDGGNGVQDFIAFILSSGDCLVYYGNDPSNFPNNWQLVGIYRISPPVNIRAVASYGGEAFLTTFDDHLPLEAQLNALKSGELPPRSKVSSAVQAAVTANKRAFGWQALYYPKGRRLIFNIPNTDGTFDQHVQNTGQSYTDRITGRVTSPWCRFKNMNAYCWGLYKDALYFGAAGGLVYQADTGNLDVLGVINATAQQAWNKFKSPRRKRITATRPVVQSTGTASFTFSLGFDYGSINIPTSVSASAVGSPWDTSPWDTTAWSSDMAVNTLWHGGGGSGVAVGIGLSIASNRVNTWLRTDFRGEIGGAL